MLICKNIPIPSIGTDIAPAYHETWLKRQYPEECVHPLEGFRPRWDALTRSKTLIMIAHCLKTVRNAGQILVLDGGKIVQRGTHQELLGQPGLYAGFVGMLRDAAERKLA